MNSKWLQKYWLVKVYQTITVVYADSSTRASCSKRQKPVHGGFKFNVDAFFSSIHNCVGINISVRVYSGNYVIVKSEWFSALCLANEG